MKGGGRGLGGEERERESKIKDEIGFEGGAWWIRTRKKKVIWSG